jgi:hypothetical protein
LADWWNERASETPVFVHISLMRLRADVERLRDLASSSSLSIPHPPSRRPSARSSAFPTWW